MRCSILVRVATAWLILASGSGVQAQDATEANDIQATRTFLTVVRDAYDRHKTAGQPQLGPGGTMEEARNLAFAHKVWEMIESDTTRRANAAAARADNRVVDDFRYIDVKEVVDASGRYDGLRALSGQSPNARRTAAQPYLDQAHRQLDSVRQRMRSAPNTSDLGVADKVATLASATKLGIDSPGNNNLQRPQTFEQFNLLVDQTVVKVQRAWKSRWNADLEVQADRSIEIFETVHQAHLQFVANTGRTDLQDPADYLATGNFRFPANFEELAAPRKVDKQEAPRDDLHGS